MTLELVRHGKVVGVTAQSHRVIANFLEAIVDAAEESGQQVRIAQRCDDPDDASSREGIVRVGSNDGASRRAERRFVRRRRRDKLALGSGGHGGRRVVLFVDEAGQLSLATVCSIGGAARSFVLLGDPQQLPQVIAGDAPGRSGSVGPRAPPRRGPDDRPGPRPLPRDHLPPPPRGERTSSPMRSTRAASSRTPRTRPRISPAGCPSAAKACGSSDCHTPAAGTAPARRPNGSSPRSRR